MTTTNQSAESFVKSLYNLHLGREAEEGGLKYWTEAITSGRLSKDEVDSAICMSDEGRAYAQRGLKKD